MEDTECLQCGDVGFTNALVYCVKCLNFAVHRYCLAVLTRDEFVHWVCDDCEANVRRQFPVCKFDDSHSHTGDCKVLKNIEVVLGTKENDLVVVQTQTNEHVYKDGPEQSYERKKSQQSSSFQQLEEEKVEANLMQQTELPAGSRKKKTKKTKTTWMHKKSNRKRKRKRNVNESATEKDQHELGKTSSEESYDACTKLDSVECGESANQRTLMQLKGKNDELAILLPADESKSSQQGSLWKKITQKKKKASKTRYRNVIECASKKDQHKLGKTSSEQSCEEHMEVDINGCARLAGDSTLPSTAKETKSSEQRDETCFSGKSFDSDTDPGSVEHPVISCNGPSSSSKKQKTIELSIPNLQKQMDLASIAQPLHENKGPDLDNQCADLSTEEKKLSSSNDHIVNKEPEDKEESTSATLLRINICRDYPKDFKVAAAEPVVTPIWRGIFSILNKKYDKLDDVCGHISSKACEKVFAAASQFQPMLQLEMLQRSEIWPKSFQTSEPSGDNIALFFFPSKISEQVYDNLVDKMMSEELGMKAVVQDAELLIFTSTELPLRYWRFNSKYYLWGVFRGKQDPSSHSHLTRGQIAEIPSIKKRRGDENPLSHSPPSEPASCGSSSF